MVDPQERLASTICKDDHRHFKIVETKVSEIEINFRVMNKNSEKVKVVSVKATKTCLDCNEIVYTDKALSL